MDRRRKSTQLFEAAREAVDNEFPDNDLSNSIILAMAVIVDQALHGGKRTKKKEAQEAGPLPFTGPDLHERLSKELPHTFRYTPVDASWWPRLNKQIRQLDLEPESLDALVAFFRSGRGSSWRKLGFEVLVSNFKRWMPEALDEGSAAPQTTHTLVRGR